MAIVAALAVLAVVGLGRVGRAVQTGGEEKPAAGPAKAGKDKDAHEEDIAAIKKASKEFAKAFEKGDAKKVAGFWTQDGEYIADDGTKYQGRDELEKAYAEFFKNNKNLKVQIDMESLRFPSKNTAVEEGYIKVRKGKSAQDTTAKYSVLHVKEDGQWQMAIVREWPGDGLNLHDIDWLIGSWQAKRDDTEVHTKYEWTANKKYILATFTIKTKDQVYKGKQIITQDLSTGTIRSWTFEDEGGFGEADWVKDGKKWVIESAGASADGARLSATNIMTPLDEDSFLWQTVDRTSDDQSLPDVPPIKVTRVKAK